MIGNGLQAPTEKTQKQPITATIQDLATNDFISLPPFLHLIRICTRLKKEILPLGNLPRDSILTGKSQGLQPAKQKNGTYRRIDSLFP
jgi:hypothetical protein